MTNQAIGGRLILGSGRRIVRSSRGNGVNRSTGRCGICASTWRFSGRCSTLDGRFQGEMLGGHTTIRVDGAVRPPLLVAAMGPQTLRVAGRYADGTDTWMTGPKDVDRTHGADAQQRQPLRPGKPPPRIVRNDRVRDERREGGPRSRGRGVLPSRGIPDVSDDARSRRASKGRRISPSSVERPRFERQCSATATWASPISSRRPSATRGTPRDPSGPERTRREIAVGVPPMG